MDTLGITGCTRLKKDVLSGESLPYGGRKLEEIARALALASLLLDERRQV